LETGARHHSPDRVGERGFEVKERGLTVLPECEQFASTEIFLIFTTHKSFLKTIKTSK